MMTYKQFLDLVEIRVVVPSIAPLLVGLAYASGSMLVLIG